MARLALLSVRRMATERFRGEGGRLLLTGNAMHADVSPEAAGSGLFGFVLAGLGQQVGYPVPRGGAQGHHRRAGVETHRERRLARLRRARRPGDRARSAARWVSRSRESRVTATKAVLADTDVVALYRHLVGAAHLPARVMDRLTRFERGPGTVKIDWALAEPIPWRDAAVRGAGTVHLADSSQELTFTTAELGERSRAGEAIRPARSDDHQRREPQPGGHRGGVGLRARAAGGSRRRGPRRHHRQVERARDRGVRPPDGGSHRVARARLPRPDRRPPHRCRHRSSRRPTRTSSSAT